VTEKEGIEKTVSGEKKHENAEAKVAEHVRPKKEL